MRQLFLPSPLPPVPRLILPLMFALLLLGGCAGQRTASLSSLLAAAGAPLADAGDMVDPATLDITPGELLGDPAAAPPPFVPPRPEIGDRAVYRILGTDKFRQDLVFAIDDQTITLTYFNDAAAPGQQECNRTYREINLSPPLSWSGCRLEPDAQQRVDQQGTLFPLAPGKAANFTITGQNARGQSWTIRRQCRTEAARRIGDGANARVTIPVVCEDDWLRSIRYIAPQVPLPVATQIEDKRNGKQIIDVLALYESYASTSGR